MSYAGGTGTISNWVTPAGGGTPYWSKCGVTVNFSLSMVSGTALTQNGTISTTATGLAGGAGIGDSSTQNGLVLNIQGSSTVNPLEQVVMTFSKPVCNLKLYLRDVSWYTNSTGASDRDAVYFSTQPTTVTNSSSGLNNGLTGTGVSGSGIRRGTCCGTVPNGNGNYYDVEVGWSASMQSLTMYYTNGTGASTARMSMQIRDISYCY